MDFLGLANLTILGKAVEIIKRTRGESIELLNRLPLDDEQDIRHAGPRRDDQRLPAWKVAACADTSRS